MAQGQVLEFSGVTKRFGAVTAVSGLTARVEPGVVTGFLGPNGAGKTTSLRILLGLVRATDGTATIGGAQYAKLPQPLQTVGAVLEASSFHPGRTAAAHLRVYAQAGGISKARVDEVLGLVGLADAAGRKVGGYSLGMRQRLGLAYALLGDPGVLVLDEPTNGLDPEGIKWIRGFLRQLAREGRTVFVSSHLLAEVQQTVDALLIISQGRLVFQGRLDELSDPGEQATVVDSPDRAALAEALRAADVPFEVLRSGLTVRGIDPTAVGAAAAAAGVPLSALHKRGPALEEVFLDLVNGTRVHASAGGAALDDVIPAIESGPAGAADGSPTQAGEADAASDAPAQEQAEAVTGGESARGEADDVAPTPDEPAGVPAADDLSGGDAEPESDVVGSEPAPHTASFAVASTGVIDIIPAEELADASSDEGVPGDDALDERIDELPEDADPDVEALGEIDAELSDAGAAEPELSPEADDRPWEDSARTEADVEADRFFAGFDEEGEERSAGPEHPIDPAIPAESTGEPHTSSTDEGGEQR